MKRFLPLLVLLAVWAIPAAAQDSNLITLDSITPGLDVVITNPENTTGVISLELDNAGITVTDSLGAAVFQMHDARARMAELRFAPNTGTHTLTIERLPGVPEAHVMINALAELSIGGTTEEVLSDAIALQQARRVTLSNTEPGHTLALSIPEATVGSLTSELTGATVTAQLVDASGAAVATLASGHIDGLNLALEGGNYDLTLLNTDPLLASTARVQVVPAPSLALSKVLPTTVSLPAQEAPQTEVANTAAAAAPACTVTINTSSINMRSGPGPGYSVMEYGYHGDEFVVGGYNPERTWILVGTDADSAWMAGQLGYLSGDCAGLPVFDIPYREAVQPQVIVQQPEPQVIYQNAPASSSQSSGQSRDSDNESSGSGS